MFEQSLDFPGAIRYNSYIRSIEHPFDGQRTIQGDVMSTVTLFLPAGGSPRTRPTAGCADPEARRVRLTARGRSVLAVLVLLLAACALALVVPPVASGGDPSGAGSGVAARVTVDPGQSLWEIAGRATPGADPRRTIARIKEMNGLSSSSIHAGQVLLVPVR
jgi:hypothetical protein